VAVLVATSVYEGPVSGLLELASERKVDLLAIPLAEVVEVFLRRLSEAPPELGELSEFLLALAVLLEMKSRLLLPAPEEADAEEDLADLEARDRLVARLVELQVYSAVAAELARLMDEAARCVPRRAGLEPQFQQLAADLLAGVGPEDLAAAYRRALSPRPVPTVDFSHVTVEPVTVSEAVLELVEVLPRWGRATFRDLTRGCSTTMQVIVRFLGLLELCKRGWVDLEQGETFGDLEVRWLAPPEAEQGVDLLDELGSLEEYGT
jgi:segregation and condensation protein A